MHVPLRAGSSAPASSSSQAPCYTAAGRRPGRAPLHRLGGGGRRALGSQVCRAEVESIKDLLSRDKKLAKTVDDLPPEDAFGEPEPVPTPAPAAAADSGGSSSDTDADVVRGKGKGKRQRARSAAAAAASVSTEPVVEAAAPAGESEGPRTAREAIDAGLAAYAARDYAAAVGLFTDALELPGSGVIRMAGSPKEYACASEGEEAAALYNMACAYAGLGQGSAALACLEGLLENGFDDFATLRSDPDLAPLRGPELDKLLGRFDNPLAKVFGRKKEGEGVQKLPPFLRPW